MIWLYILGLRVITVYQKILPFLESHVLLSPLKFKPSFILEASHTANSLGIWRICRFRFRSGTWESALRPVLPALLSSGIPWLRLRPLYPTASNSQGIHTPGQTPSHVTILITWKVLKYICFQKLRSAQCRAKHQVRLPLYLIVKTQLTAVMRIL